MKQATIGKVIDMGVSNALDLGSAMAPAAADTIIAHLNDTELTLEQYDCIVTGDLSRVGSGILRKLLQEKGYLLKNNYEDCGVMIYHPEQPVFFREGADQPVLLLSRTAIYLKKCKEGA